jgi:hypothetical protein
LLTLAVGLGSLGCGPPVEGCEEVTGAPLLLLGGTDDAAEHFERYTPGSERNLVLGPQGGMHVWLSAQLRGLCPNATLLDRRVVDDLTGSVYLFNRAPAEWVEVEPGVFELTDAVPLILCPEPLGRPVVGRPLRVYASVVDDDGRRAEAQLAFTPRCPDGMDCESICR